ncbi:MAG: hypothetical protein WDZ39_00910 [Candidatus Spechtbacterales bacterium]
MLHKNIKIIRGKTPVLISAPHAAPIKKTVEGRTYVRLAEDRVDELVEILCKELGAWGMFTQSKEPIAEWQKEVYGIYKKTAKNIIEEQNICLFLDVHGAKRSRPFYIDYDFVVPEVHAHDNHLEDLVRKHFSNHFPKHRLSKGFFRNINGPGEKTLTYHIRKNLNMPALQLEINKALKENEETFEKTVKILHSVIKDYENSITRVQPKKEIIHR